MSEHSAQCEQILRRLMQGPATTADLVIGLRIMSVTKRIHELRKHHEILASEQRVGRKRIVTYYLMSGGSGTALTDGLERSRTLTDEKLRCSTCTECGNVFERKPKARPLKPDELPFCKDSCRSAHWRRRRGIEAQQSLDFSRERLRSEREPDFPNISTVKSTRPTLREGAA
jgi:hypothetical protein